MAFKEHGSRPGADDIPQADPLRLAIVGCQ